MGIYKWVSHGIWIENIGQTFFRSFKKVNMLYVHIYVKNHSNSYSYALRPWSKIDSHSPRALAQGKFHQFKGTILPNTPSEGSINALLCRKHTLIKRLYYFQSSKSKQTVPFLRIIFSMIAQFTSRISHWFESLALVILQPNACHHFHEMKHFIRNVIIEKVH